MSLPDKRKLHYINSVNFVIPYRHIRQDVGGKRRRVKFEGKSAGSMWSPHR